jgi:hypothetical protein
LSLIPTVTIFVGALTALLACLAAALRFYNERKKKKILEDLNAEGFVSQYNEAEIRRAVSGYVAPHCSPGDPANREQEGHLADTRENIFRYFDRTINEQSKSFHLLLADTGMGKTAFCLNYFYHLKNRNGDLKCCLVSLASGGYKSHIRKIRSKSNYVLILDAFDELAAGEDNALEKFHELIKFCEDFRCVIITCRSQYFQGEDFIPRETELPNLSPKGLNSVIKMSLIRSYISPFDRKEITKYISNHFPLWKPWCIAQRRRASTLADNVPDLAYRPMLLEQLPLLVSSEEKGKELYDLYTALVDGWINREKKWISRENLTKASFELAYELYCQRNVDRVTKAEVQKIAELALGQSPDWSHLSARSLLNCDSKGRYKFAHRSIMEYLLVRMAVEGDLRAIEAKWTPFMKELFISWGHSNKALAAAEQASIILKSKNAKKNLYPLYEIWLGNTVGPRTKIDTVINGLKTSHGQRLAPKSWRDQSLQIKNDNDIWRITDLEFNIIWELISSSAENADIPNLNIKEVESVVNNRTDIRLPYVDELITLLDATEHMGESLISDGDRYMLGDYISAKQKLIAHIGDYDKRDQNKARIFSKTKSVRGNGRKITLLVTGIDFHRQYHTLRVKQLYVRT